MNKTVSEDALVIMAWESAINRMTNNEVDVYKGSEILREHDGNEKQSPMHFMQIGFTLGMNEALTLCAAMDDIAKGA